MISWSVFTSPTVFTDTASLRATFGTDRVELSAGARLICTGRIGLGPNVVFAGECSLSGPVEVADGCLLTNIELRGDTRVRAYSILSDLRAGERNLFGPFCFIRDFCVVDSDVILGAHVEAARSRFASGVKVSHRAFIGDAEIGQRTIIGAGVVFCNYDGQGRQATRVGADVTVGSGTMLVPPLTIGDGALIAAASVVAKNVPPGVKILQKRQ